MNEPPLGWKIATDHPINILKALVEQAENPKAYWCNVCEDLQNMMDSDGTCSTCGCDRIATPFWLRAIAEEVKAVLKKLDKQKEQFHAIDKRDSMAVVISGAGIGGLLFAIEAMAEVYKPWMKKAGLMVPESE